MLSIVMHNVTSYGLTTKVESAVEDLCAPSSIPLMHCGDWLDPNTIFFIESDSLFLYSVFLTL